MNRPKTRIGVAHGLLKTHGVTQAKLAGFAGCKLPQMKKLVKPPAEDGRRLDESYAVGIAVETDIGVDWLMGRVGHLREPLTRFMGPWKPEMYLQIQKGNLANDSIQAVAGMCMKYFLINSERLASIILAGFKQNKANLVLSRIHMALTRLAKDFEAHEPDRTLSILRRTISRRRPVDRTSSVIARRFCRELWAHVRHTPTKRSTETWRLEQAAEKHSQSTNRKPCRR